MFEFSISFVCCWFLFLFWKIFSFNFVNENEEDLDEDDEVDESPESWELTEIDEMEE